MPAALPTSSLSAMAKAITSFLFGDIQLPTSLSHYATFFAGLVTGSIGASILHAYLHRNKCDRAKIQLAVYHIIRLFQQDPSYQAQLQHPQELLRRMEPEVLRMLNTHLTKNEADKVAKELKRAYEAPQAEEHGRKRMREDTGGALREQMELDTVPAHRQAQRGFLPELGPDQARGKNECTEDGVTSQPENEAASSLEAQGSRSDSLVEGDDLDDYNLPTPDEKQLQVEHGQYDEDMMDLDLPQPNVITTPGPHYRQSYAPSPESSSTFVGFASTPTPVPNDDGYLSDDESEVTEEWDDLETPVAEPPKMSNEAKSEEPMKLAQPFRRQGYGFTYDDPDLYSSSSSEEDASSPTPPPDDYTAPDWINNMFKKAEDLTSDDRHVEITSPREQQTTSHPPTVIAMIRGVKGRGTSLSPIPEGNSDDRAVPQEHVEASPPAQNDLTPSTMLHTQMHANTAQAEEMQAQPAPELPFAHWSTTPVMTYSDSESSDSGSETGSPTPSVQIASHLSSRSAAGSATPPSNGESAPPVIHQTINISSTIVIQITPAQDAQSARDGTETEPTPEPTTPLPRRSAAHPASSPVPSYTSPSKKYQYYPHSTNARRQSPREDLHSPPKKRKSASLSLSPSEEQEQDHISPRPSKRHNSSPLRDITASHYATPPSEEPSPGKGKPQKRKSPRHSRGRGRGRRGGIPNHSPRTSSPPPPPLSSSPVGAAAAAAAVIAAAVATPAAPAPAPAPAAPAPAPKPRKPRKSTRKAAYGGTYPK
ncbi:hypothetical protein EKO04_000305 [Ascochyta lentis]|uniref:Uncharacterized protein n=1 Tax=Ascochyta lentis TaxID=205686 RepID=A0A8H7JDJ8_9PLEO|nr:hypothetical protein EKO04_000305 [Ascochyta lentis]